MKKYLLGLSIIAASVLITQKIITSEIEVKTAEELILALKENRDVIVSIDTLDLSDYDSIFVNSNLNLNKSVILFKNLPESGETQLFLAGSTQHAKIFNGTIIGPNGNLLGVKNGYFCAIKILTTANIDNVNFINCDKFSIYSKGIRSTFNDTSTVTNCTFTNNLRSSTLIGDSLTVTGYGYCIWNQYSTIKVSNNYFNESRHFIDGSSEGHVYIIENNIFDASGSNYAIHHHEYCYQNICNKSGNGFIFKNNTIFSKTTPVEIYRAFNNKQTIFENNYFVVDSLSIGKISGQNIVTDTSVWKSNFTNAKNINLPPILIGSTNVKVNEPITIKASGYDSLVWVNEERPIKSSLPKVTVYSVYGIDRNNKRSLTAYKTVTVKDTGSYFGVKIKTMGNITCKLYQDSVLIKTFKPDQTKNWKHLLQRGKNIYIQFSGQGEVLIDDVHSNLAFETFENTNKIKLKYNQVPGKTIKAGRFSCNAATGLYCFKFFIPGGSINLNQ